VTGGVGVVKEDSSAVVDWSEALLLVPTCVDKLLAVLRRLASASLLPSPAPDLMRMWSSRLGSPCSGHPHAKSSLRPKMRAQLGLIDGKVAEAPRGRNANCFGSRTWNLPQGRRRKAAA
jgi:hypothetical protein